MRLLAFIKRSPSLLKLVVLVAVLSIGLRLGLVYADNSYTVSGIITVGGNPLPDTQGDIYLNTPNGDGAGGGSSTSDGNYSISGLPNDDYNATITGDSPSLDVSVNSSTPFINVNGANLTQNIAFNTVNDTVTVDDGNGNPVSGAAVAISSTNGGTFTDSSGNSWAGNVEANGTTGSNGTVTLAVIPGTDYQVCAFTSSGGQYCDSLTTISSDTAAMVYLEPTPTAPTNLTIPSPTNAPVLTWTGVSDADSYNIYANGTKIGSTTSTTYTDNSPTVGNETYYVTAVNLAGESIPSNSVSVTVTNNISPTITSSSITTFVARELSSFSVTTTGFPIPTITETGSLPTGITFTDNGDGTATLAGQASPVNNGLYAITITATNTAGTTTQTLYLSVNDAQTAPTIVSADNLTESYGVPFSFTVDTTGNPLPKINKVAGSGSLPTGITLKDNNDGTATLSGELANANDSGTYTFTLQAKNSNGTATQPFTLVITKTPVINNVPTKTAIVNTAYSQTITASGDPTPNLSVVGLPNGLSFSDSGDGTGTISGTPAIGSGNVYTVTITATNIEGSTTESFTMKINEEPSITSNNTTTATTGISFGFQVTATGYPAPSFSETGTLPKGITFKNSTGTFSGIPATGTTGTYPVTVTAKNSQGSDSQSFVLTVQ